MYYTINNSDKVTFTIGFKDLNTIEFLLTAAIISFFGNDNYSHRLNYYRSLRDVFLEAIDEIVVYNNPDFMEGDK